MRSIQSHIMYSREDNEESILNSCEMERQGNTSNDYMQQFSFNRQLKKNNQSFIKQKYSQIYADLKVMKIDDVIDLLLQQLQENEKYKAQISSYINRTQALQQQLAQSRQALKKKSQAISLLCETQSKNLQLIEKLENKISKKNQYGRDTHYEKKYQQLSVYMNEYIRNINQAQEQFKKAYSTLKNENLRLNKQLQQHNNQSSNLSKKVQILAHKYKRSQQQLMRVSELYKRISGNLNILNEENENLRKQIQVYQQNIRITDRLQIHFSHQHNQISSDLDFIRQKICQNQTISKDIIQKLQQSSANCEKVNKQKHQAIVEMQKNNQKKTQLEQENNQLKKKNQQLMEELEKCKKQLQYILQERQDIEDELTQQKLQKQTIRKQLLNLADKVRLMESTYRKQIEQSEKIKGQLFKFWQNKEKKEGMIKDINVKVLGQIKVNGCDYSQSTFTHSEKQSKLSLWNKRSDQQTNSNLQQKENIQEHYSQDSLSS